MVVGRHGNIDELKLNHVTIDIVRNVRGESSREICNDDRNSVVESRQQRMARFSEENLITRGPPEERIVTNDHNSMYDNTIDHNNHATLEVDGRCWIDEKHEEDGTEPNYIDTGNGTREHSMHTADDAHAVTGPQPYFKTGVNHGARVLREAMMALTQGGG